jgi:3-mercaptopyruvate sulfurtransferase SseA
LRAVRTVIDARSPGALPARIPSRGRFKKLGHIPGSRNLPFGRLMDRNVPTPCVRRGDRRNGRRRRNRPESADRHLVRLGGDGPVVT